MNVQLSYGNLAINNAHVRDDALKCIMTDVGNISCQVCACLNIEAMQA